MKSKTKKSAKKYPLLQYIKERNREAEDTIRMYAALETHIKELRALREVGAKETLDRCRAGTILESIVQLFWDKTDLPLTLPYWFGLGVLGGILTQAGKQILYGDQAIDPNLWVLILAESGMGKTWTLNRIKKLTDGGVLLNQAGYRTKPALIHDLVQYPEMSRSVLCVDEMAQTIKLFRKETGADLKEALLMSYDGYLASTTKKDGRVEVPDIALSILATTVLSTFARSITDEDTMDGFLQRFLMVKANDTERNMKNWPYLITESDTAGIQQQFREWRDRIAEIGTFTLTASAHNLWTTWYQKHFSADLESYYKRYLWSTLKLAAIFHTLGPTVDGQIDTDDMGYAIRALDNSLESLYDIMDRHLNFSRAEQQVQTIRGHLERYPDRTSREILQSLKLSKGELVTALKILRDRGQVTEGVYHRLVK